MDQTPSVGRIVHYTSYGTPGGEYRKECRAAIVTEVNDATGEVALCVLNPTGQFFNQHVPHDDVAEPKIAPGPSGREGGTWHWPERV